MLLFPCRWGGPTGKAEGTMAKVTGPELAFELVARTSMGTPILDIFIVRVVEGRPMGNTDAPWNGWKLGAHMSEILGSAVWGATYDGHFSNSDKMKAALKWWESLNKKLYKMQSDFGSAPDLAAEMRRVASALKIKRAYVYPAGLGGRREHAEVKGLGEATHYIAQWEKENKPVEVR